jgi:signal transduction histidine kinase
MARGASPSRARLPLAHRLFFGLTVLCVAMASVLGAAAWAYERQVTARSHLVNVVDQARLVAELLLADYVNEETGVRGYILSGQAAFLQPYTQGVGGAVGDRKQLGTLEAREPASRHLLAEVDDAAQLWRSKFALPAIAATEHHQGTFASVGALEEGKREFDNVRAAFSALDAALRSSALSSTTTLNDSQTVFIFVAGVLITLLVVSVGAATWSLRSWVTAPLASLRSDIREVAGGNLDHPVRPVGPPDLADLALDVDAMREQIVSEVRSLGEASAVLQGLNAELERSNSDLEHSNAELEQFAYVASHDLQEPLRKVVSFCDLLSRRYGEQLDDRAREYIAFAVDGATRMQTLINDLLALSRVGRTTSEFVTVDVGHAFELAVANLDSFITQAGATVTSDPLPRVNGDLALLVALLQNLIGNAIKFNQSGAPEVRVSVARDGDYWQFAITDNGIGIEPRFAERIFVIFQRLHGRDLYDGTGIGLAMGKKIVEFHSGRIWLDTDYPSGTRIYWTIPIAGAS